jgi:phosphatidyl-myo-inositol alpha-mannosyltransferase
MKVGLVCPYDLGRPGGVQQQVLDLGRKLAAEGNEITVLGPGAGVVADGPFTVFQVGRVRPIRANGSVVPLAVGWGVSRRIRDAVSDLDVLHVHEPLMPVVGPAALRAGRPVVATFHAMAPRWISLAYRGFSGRWIARRWFAGVVMTAVSAEAARGPASLAPITVIPNGLDVAIYEDATAKVPGRVVFLGRDEPRKGLQVLLAAWPLVLLSHPNATLVVLGADGRGSNPDPSIEYRGRVSESEKRRLLGEASVMAAPNLGGESFGLVVVEAMASGCAVVASDLPAFRAVVADAALLVPPGSAIELGRAIARLLSEPAAIAALHTAGRRRAQDFDWSQVLPQYRASYQRAIDGGGRL